MIYHDIQITVNQGLAVPDKSLYIFRGDSNITINFKLVTPQYILTKEDKDNLVTRFGVNNFELRLHLEKGYDKIIQGVITADGCCRIQLTQNTIQELRVGSYTYQITLIDEDSNGIITFPACNNKFNIVDRLSLNGQVIPMPDITGEAITGLSLVAHDDEVLEAFDSDGNYIKTVWKTGEVIGAGRLNKIENALNQINDNVNSQLAPIKTQVYNVKDYGAKGDGVTDDSEAILRAVSSMRKNNVELYFPPGIYIHGDGVTTGFSYTPASEGSTTPHINDSAVNIGRDIRIIFEGFKNVVVNGYGAEIRSNDNNGECRNNAILKFIDCENVVVKGLRLNGRREQRKPKFSDYSVYDSGERGNLHVCRCDKVTLKDIESINAMMDGICVYGDNITPSTNVDITNCICNYNYRQGLTLSMVEKCNINGGHYSYNGHGGTLPMSGIDIEADWGGVGNKHIHINGIYCVNNASSNLIFAAGLDGCNVTNCYFEGRSLSSHDTARNITVRDCRFNNCTLSGSLNINYFNNTCEYSFLDTDIISNTLTHIVIDYADADNPYGVPTTYFKGNTIICDLNNIPSDFQGKVGFIRTTKPVPLVFEDNIVINSLSCSDYVFMFNGCKELKNNMFLYNSELDFENKTNVIQGIFRNNTLDYKRICSNNIITGYDDDQYSYTVDTVVDLEGKQQTSIFLDFTSGKLYKINTGNVFTEIVTHNSYNDIANLTLNYMRNTSTATKNTTTEYVEFYKDSLNNYYIATLSNYVLVEITRLALGYNKKIKNNEPLLVLTDIDKSTLTKIEYSS